ncbi:MAG: hypothetical protein IPI01_16185 [Ignavibacteriae bacterium]|nr:hypothetical protein [Ignavibacteriota bacterium]
MNRGALILLAVLLAGALLRLPDLAVRPMHTDEAVHAVKFGTLLESGDYRYDPYEYHGPTLNFLTLIPAWMGGVHMYAALQEWHLRIVPAVCGILLLALFLLFDPHRALALGPPCWPPSPLRWCSTAATISRRWCSSSSPLCFAAGIHRYLQVRTRGWAVFTGVAAGLMFATKETSVITFGVIGAACIVVWLMHRQRGERSALPPLAHWLIAGASAFIVIIVFYSSFGRNPRGVLDAFGTFAVYVERAGTTGRHLHPWYYYLQMLGWSHAPDGRLWTEAGILLFAGAGFVRAWKERFVVNDPAAAFRVTTAIATLLMLAIISVMPYKTPWVMLTALLGLIIMAGSGIETFLAGADRMRVVRFMLVAGIVIHLGWEAWSASFAYADRPGNPYVYAHPTGDVIEIGKAVTALAAAAPSPISVVVCYQDGDYWPMPWYLRTIAQTGWWSSVPDSLPRADVVLVSPELESSVTKALYERSAPGERPLYVTLFSRPAYVRPGREIRVYTTLALRELGQRAGGK